MKLYDVNIYADQDYSLTVLAFNPSDAIRKAVQFLNILPIAATAKLVKDD